MKLNVVPAAQGAQWVKLGVRTFFRQPLALAGLFFMFMALVAVFSLVPVLGSVLTLVVMPACTLGLMTATHEAASGRFPMPILIFSALRAGPEKMRAMLILGALYALAVFLIVGLSTVFDGGQFAQMYLFGGTVSREIVQQPDFQLAMLTTSVLYAPLSLVFWYAPALVYWHGMPAIKSLFISGVVGLRNFRAFLVFALTWIALFFVVGIGITLLAGLVGGSTFVNMAMFPSAMLMAAMFFTSIYFTYKASFDGSDSEELQALPK